MKKCISCLNEIPAKTKFCTKCGGTHFSENSEIRVDVKAKCPGRNEFCGNELDSNDKFCGECGLEVDISLFKSDELGKQFNEDKNNEVGQDLDTGSNNIQKESALSISETRSSNAESEEVEHQTDGSDSEIDSLQSREHEEKIQSSSVAEENTEEKKCKKKKKKKKKKKHSLKLETEAEDLSDPTLNLPENQETSNSGDNVDQSLRTYVSEEAEHTNHEMKNAGHMVSKENIKLKDMTKQNEMGELEDLSPKENKETECSEPRPENEKRTNIIQNESKLVSTETVNIAAESDSCHSLPEEVVESEFDATDSEQDSLECQETEENITPEKAFTKRKPKKKKKKKKKSKKQNGNDSREMQQKHSDPNTSSDISYPPKINNIISEVTEENKASKDSQMVFGNGKLSVEEKVIKIGQNQDKSDNHKSADDKDGAEGTSVDKPEEKEKKYPTYKEFDPYHKKKKKTTKTEQTLQKTPTEETKPGKTEANSVRLYSDGVEVIFHVLISDTTDHNPDEEDIYLAFSPVELGQWKPTKWIGKLRKTKDYYEYSFSVHMSKQLRNDGFEYKYVFVKNNCTDSEEVHFMKKRTRNPNPDRKFILPKNWKTSSDVWNQYDGFVYHPKPKESLWNKAKSIFKNINTKVKNDTRNAVEHFLPSAGEIIQSLKKEDGQTEDFLSRIFCVMSCLKIQVIDSDGYFDPDFFSECFDLIVLPLYEELRQCINNNKNCGISEHALSVAVFILMLVKENNLEMSKYDDRAGNFFQGLLLKPDFEKECCTNYDLMKRNFPQKKTQDLICKTLEEMVRGHSKNAENDSSWFYCLSLIHFLRGDSEPFKTSQCSEHRNRKWWGTDGFEKIKEDMKHCSDRYLNSRNWTIPVQNVIEDLHMLFEVDYLLPRSIMASLSLGQLESAIRPGKIPPHVVAACLFFHLLSFRGHYTVLELFTKLFKLCASQFNERIEKAIVSSVDKLNEELNISRAIVTDIVKENISGTTDDELVMSIMSVCLSVVDGLKLLQQRIVKNRAESSSEQKNEADNLVQYLEMIALVWLEHKHTFKYVSNHQWSLKAWNNMINIKIQNPELKQHWQKTLLAAFEQKISSVSE